jgi:hypothetical protein
MDKKTIEKLIKQNEVLIKALQKAGNTSKKTSKKTKSKPKPKQPDIPYNQTTDIIKEMSVDENKSRFGILYNAENPYNAISGKSITKFYKDKGIKAFKVWHMSYKNKDEIIKAQLQGMSKKIKQRNLNARIKHIEEQLNKKRKPSGKSFNVNHIDKINQALINQLERLEHEPTQ